MRLEIIVSFRMAASAEVPLSPMWFFAILRDGRGRGGERTGVSMGADRKANAWARRRTSARSQRSP